MHIYFKVMLFWSDFIPLSLCLHVIGPNLNLHACKTDIQPTQDQQRTQHRQQQEEEQRNHKCKSRIPGRQRKKREEKGSVSKGAGNKQRGGLNSNTKLVWKQIKKLMGTDQQRCNKQLQLKSNGEILQDPADLEKAFNEYFIDAVAEIACFSNTCENLIPEEYHFAHF